MNTETDNPTTAAVQPKIQAKLEAAKAEEKRLWDEMKAHEEAIQPQIDKLDAMRSAWCKAHDRAGMFWAMLMEETK